MLALRIALRYLFSRKSHNAVNILSMVSVAGVAVATAAMVIVLSVFNGFNDLAESKLSQLDPDIRVRPVSGKVITGVSAVIDSIEAIPGVAVAAPELTEQAFAVSGDHQMPVTIKGMTSRGAGATRLDNITIDGAPILIAGNSDRYGTAVMSVGAAVGLNCRPGSDRLLRIFVPRRTGRINPANPMAAFRSDTLRVEGVFQVEQPEYDTDMIMIPFDDARRLLEYSNDEAGSIEVFISPDADIDHVIRSLRLFSAGRFTVLDRLQQQQQAFRMIEIEKWVTFLMLAFILVITSFNIISSIYILKVEKAANMFVLNAMGATRHDIASIFAWQGRLITLAGGAIGIILGVSLSLAQQWWGFIGLSATNMSAMSIDAYPVRVVLTDVIAVAAIVTVIAFIASYIATASRRHR